MYRTEAKDGVLENSMSEECQIEVGDLSFPFYGAGDLTTRKEVEFSIQILVYN